MYIDMVEFAKAIFSTYRNGGAVSRWKTVDF
jgi:hypothetical protein